MIETEDSPYPLHKIIFIQNILLYLTLDIEHEI
jgi:hypothetical protein